LDSLSNTFIAIPSSFNPTSIRDTFVVHSTRKEDAGKYRCRTIGCSADNVTFTDTVEIKIRSTVQIMSQPVELYICRGDNLMYELSVAVSEVAGISFVTQFR